MFLSFEVRQLCFIQWVDKESPEATKKALQKMWDQYEECRSSRIQEGLDHAEEVLKLLDKVKHLDASTTSLFSRQRTIRQPLHSLLHAAIGPRRRTSPHLFLRRTSHAAQAQTRDQRSGPAATNAAQALPGDDLGGSGRRGVAGRTVGVRR